MKTLSLAGSEWTVMADGHGPFPAFVPGCVHDALVTCGEILDPDMPGGEDAQAFIGRTDWTWRTSFEVDPLILESDEIALVFDSVDTVGIVRLNDVVIGTVASQFIPYRFAIKDAIQTGRNELEVVLLGTLAEAERLEQKHGSRPVNADGAWGPFSQLRKSACNFGWDWGPCCPTCGFAGDVRIEAWNGPRIDAVRTHVSSADATRAVLCVDVDIDGDEVRRHVVVRAEGGQELASSSGTGQIELEIPDPPLWWPREMGPQQLVTLEVELETGHVASVRTGLRTVKIDRGGDDGFTVCVNGVSVFCRGANWIPSRLFPHAQTIDDVEPLLQAACECNMNMLRIWGGGIYEPSWLYERCDELGIMVWQDFMFACATYPEHEEIVALVEQEARAQVARLARHPSIMLWCGGNEDMLAWYSWGWRDQLDAGQAWGQQYWANVLPKVCAQLDPTRPYWTESPWSGSLDIHPNDPDVGDRHTWDLKVEGYRELVPRFVSEFGHQAPPTQRSLEEVLGTSSEMLAPSDLAPRQRAWGGDAAQYAPYLKTWFGIESDSDIPFDRWLWAAQLLQSRAMSIGCTWLRANSPRCTGALIWQLNDVWTGHSWSLLDVKHRRKPVFHAVQAAFAPCLLTIEPIDSTLSVVLVNDSAQDEEGTMEVRRVGFNGEVALATSFAIAVPPHGGRSVVALPVDLATPGDRSSELLVASMGDRAAYWFFEKDLQLNYPEAALEVAVEQHEDTATLQLRASSLVRDLWVQADAVGSSTWAATGMFTLLPGEERTVHLAGIPAGVVLDEAMLRANRALRSANELG